ncbi:MAG TPA: hypothetical protein VKY19_20675 [Ktedonosporobacter sp.]|jgi:hypothetical protein|nr:hypothetical protein [Ktedonosporobacter sp.]
MSGRIAHRPRYRLMHHPVQTPPNARRLFLHNRWTYRRQQPSYEKRPLGYGLALLPFGYRLLVPSFHYQR